MRDKAEKRYCRSVSTDQAFQSEMGRQNSPAFVEIVGLFAED